MSIKTILKNSEVESIIKVTGSNGDVETILLNDDIVSASQIAETTTSQVVNINGAQWTGATDGVAQIYRNDVLITTLNAAASGAVEMNGQMMMPDTTENLSDIVIQFSGGQSEVWLRLKKVSGYKSKIEYGLYGSYDNEDVIGPRDISGSPGPAEMPRSMLPVVGSGNYQFTLSTDTSEAGTAYEDTSYYYDTPPSSNMVPGLYRRAFVGNFADAPNNGIDVNFCRNNPGWYGQADTYVGFGNQDLENASNYTFEWTGWFKAPVTGTYNFWLQSDDDAYMWMNYPALADQNGDGNQIVSTSNDLTKISNSLILTADCWYPVRIQYGEWGGAEMCQVYWSTTSDEVAYAGNDNGTSGYTVWYHNGDTKGI